MTKQPDDVSTDYQKRAELLEELVPDTLLYLKSISEYNWRTGPNCIKLQDRAAELGIVPEVRP